MGNSSNHELGFLDFVFGLQFGFGLRICTFGLQIWTLVQIEKSKLDLVQIGLWTFVRSPGRDFLDLSPSPN